MNALLEQFLWVIYPYIALALFAAGLVWRYETDQFGWTSKSSEILEKRWLAWGNNLFHYGFLAVFGGHVMGLLIPPSVDQSLGMSDASYHIVSYYGGAAAGIIAVAGLVILTARRIGVPRVRATSTPSDWLTLALLLGVMGLGLGDTLGYTALVGPFDYRDTIGVWFRGLITLSPSAAAMAGTPLSFQAHVLAGLTFFALFPLTRLVHMLSLPFHYLTRRFVVFRSQRSIASVRGTSGR